LRQAWVAACLEFDEARAEQVLVEGFACLDLETVVTGVLQNGLSRIGDLWYEGKATVQQEHFATELAVRRVEALLVAKPPPSRRELIIVAAPPGEQHGFSLLLVTLLLRRRGWSVLNLGSDVPIAHMAETVAGQHPSMVISVAQQLATAVTLREMAATLRQQGVATGYGGWVFERIPEVRGRIPGHYLGRLLQCVPEEVEALTGTPLPPAAAESLPAGWLAALAQLREREPAMEAELSRFLGGLDLRDEHLEMAVRQLPRHLDAAFSLGDLGYMVPCLEWTRGLLANLGLPDDLLPRYLEAYHQAAVLHLDGRCEPVLGWLAGLEGGAGWEAALAGRPRVRDEYDEVKEKGVRGQ
jgi:methanogenic corrinoid protein MtbC1